MNYYKITLTSLGDKFVYNVLSEENYSSETLTEAISKIIDQTYRDRGHLDSSYFHSLLCENGLVPIGITEAILDISHWKDKI